MSALKASLEAVARARRRRRRQKRRKPRPRRSRRRESCRERRSAGGKATRREEAQLPRAGAPPSGNEGPARGRPACGGYRAKRDFAATPEPAPGEALRTSERAALCDPRAQRQPTALGSASRARRGARFVGDPEGPAARRQGQPLRGAHRGPPARVPRLPGRDPEGAVRRGHDRRSGITARTSA